MKPVFDREKLEKRLEELKQFGPQPTIEYYEAEMERCRDPLYFYNNYWTVNGKPVKPMTQEEWDLHYQQSMEMRLKRRRP